MKVEVGRIAPDQLPYAWDDICDLVQRHGNGWLRTVHLGDVGCSVQHEVLDCWLATKGDKPVGVMFASWEKHRYEADYHINWIAGREMKIWFQPGIEKLEKYVQMCGGDALVVTGRFGWHKLLAPRGFVQHYAARKVVTPMKGVH